MIKVKATRKIKCAICGCELKRRKTFKIFGAAIDGIKIMLDKQAGAWKLTERQKHCSICWSIKNDIR